MWWRYPKTEGDRSTCAPAQHAFAQLEQVVFSPHRGGLTVETERLRGHAVAKLLDQVIAEIKPDHVVDRDAGY